MAAVLSGLSELEVAQENGDAALILTHIRRWDPDVVFLAARLNRESGLDLLPQLHAEAPDTPIVILTMNRSVAFVQRALGDGASGVVLKDHADSELLPAVQAVAGGQPFVSPLIAD